MFISNASNTKINTYRECPYCYYLKYVLYLMLPSKNEDILNFGSYIHKVFEKGVNCKHISELEKIAEQYKEDYHISYKFNKQITTCLTNFLKFNSSLSETIGLELNFKEQLQEGITFNGIIDRVIKSDTGQYLIIDYKTSKREKNKFELYNDEQLMGYVWAISKIYKVPVDKIIAAHFYPKTGNFVNVTYGRQKIYNWQTKIIETIWKIRKAKKTDFPEIRNDFCAWRGCTDLCSFFNKDAQSRNSLLNEMIEQAKAKKPITE